MKTVNLPSIIDINEHLSEDILRNFLESFGCNRNFRLDEIMDIKSFCEKLIEQKVDKKVLFDYYLGYTIPQIGKEFDLLRFGINYVLNIEIKRTSTDEIVKEQLIKNKYYLSVLNKNIYFFSYVVDTNTVYLLTNDDELKIVDINELYQVILAQNIEFTGNIDDLFEPSIFLVSPFNSTEKFISEKYFLTEHQKNIKQQIFNIIDNYTQSFFAITGSAGTGKTLLTYDIAKDMIKKHNKVLILHCGQLNTGQLLLKNNCFWHINSTKTGLNTIFSIYQLIIVDEAQRASLAQIDQIVEKTKAANINCIFSYDKIQCLKLSEEKQNISEIINKLADKKIYKLTDKIRTNKEVATFIKSLRNKYYSEKQDFKNIEFCYLQQAAMVKSLLSYLDDSGWIIPTYTPSIKGMNLYSALKYENYQLSRGDSAHAVIGQEFDKVVAVIDENFYYDQTGKLKSNYNQVYDQEKMLFQILTRTRKKLYIIIFNNPIILERCIEIFK